MAVFLIDEIQPKNAGTFAMLQDTYLKGGFRVVADVTARDAITSQRRSEGMFVAVVADGKLYRLIGGILNANWVEYAPTSSPAPGGSDTQVQFNDAGVLAGDPGLVFDKTTNNLTASGIIQGSALYAVGVTSLSPGEMRLTRPGTTGSGQISSIDMYAYDGLFTSTRRGYIQLAYDTAATDSYMTFAVSDASNSTTVGLVVTKTGVGIGNKPAAGTKLGIGTYHKTTLSGGSLGTSPTNFSVFSVASVRSYWVTARIVMRCAGASGNNMAMFYIACAVHQESGIFLNGPTDVLAPIQTGAASSFTATFAISGGALCLQLIGNSGLTVNWQAEVEWQEVQ